MRKYKLFGKIPIFDVVVVLVLLVIVFIGYKVVNSSKMGVNYTTREPKEIIFTAVFDNISEQITDLPEIGEKVLDDATNTTLGTVCAVKKEAYTMHDFDSEGNLIETPCPDRYTLVVDIKTTANISEVSTEINGTKIGLGKIFILTMPSLSTTAYISDIREVA